MMVRRSIHLQFIAQIVSHLISSLTLNAILELNFVQWPCNSVCDSVT